MSNCWSEDDYAQILGFVEKHLWLFVQDNAAIHRPKQVICNLTQLNYSELRLLQNIYFLLSEPVQKSIRESIPYLLRHLTQSAALMNVEVRGSIRGNIDWGRTQKLRLNSGFADQSLFATRVTIRAYNLPELQAVKYLLVQINRLCVEVLGHALENGAATIYQAEVKWKETIVKLLSLSNICLKHACLSNVDLVNQVNDLTLQRVRCARNISFKEVHQALQLHRKLFIKEEQKTLRECLANGVLKPLSQDTLYEIYVLFAAFENLELAGWHRKNLKLIGYGKGAVAQYTCGKATLRIYYQALPKTFSFSSLYTDLLRRYDIDVNSRRPDILLEFESSRQSFILLEVKRTQNKEYIVDSVYKVFGYLKDFEAKFVGGPLPHALLVVWNGIKNVDNRDDVIRLLDYTTFNMFFEDAFKVGGCYRTDEVLT